MENFSVTESLIRNPLTGRSLVDTRVAPLYPRGVFLKIDRIEGGDDQTSSAQREWSVRTVDSEPGS